MKKCIILVATMICLAFPSFAEEFSVDEYARIDGMKYSWYQGYTPAIQGASMTLYLPLRAKNCVGDIRASFALDDPNVFLLNGQPREVVVSSNDGIYPVKLIIPLQYQRRNGDYPATIVLQGVDASGKEIREAMPYVIRIRDGQSSHETLQPVIRCEDVRLDVGAEGSLTLCIENPTSTVALSEGAVTVTEDSGEILMAGSNQISIPEILPGKSAMVTVPMIVSAEAKIKEHSFRVSLRYQALGQPGGREETVTLPVKQEICLEHGSANLPSVIAGDVGTLTLPLMNMGKGELRNVLLKLEVKGMNEQSVLVGNMASGETRQAKLTFIPNAQDVGDHTGIVTVRCEDAYGNQNEQTVKVSLTVEEEPALQDAQQMEQKAKIDPVKIVLGILCGLLAIGMIVQGCLLTGKIHRLEEERL